MSFGGSVRIPADTSPADWIAPRLGEFGTVGGLVPAGFDGYVLVEHIPGDYDQDWDASRELVDQIAALLGSNTSTPEAGWFAVWEGYGFFDVSDLSQVPKLDLPNRRYFLLTGAVAAAALLERPDPSRSRGFQPPDLWWPEDRSWFVATDTDLPWSYVGADEGVCGELARCFPDRTMTVPWEAWNGGLLRDLRR